MHLTVIHTKDEVEVWNAIRLDWDIHSSGIGLLWTVPITATQESEDAGRG